MLATESRLPKVTVKVTEPYLRHAGHLHEGLLEQRGEELRLLDEPVLVEQVHREAAHRERRPEAQLMVHPAALGAELNGLRHPIPAVDHLANARQHLLEDPRLALACHALAHRLHE